MPDASEATWNETGVDEQEVSIGYFLRLLIGPCHHVISVLLKSSSWT